MKARRGWAWPLVPLYAAGLAAKDGLRAVGVLRNRRLEWPVVSVGSLSAGGAGKTPVVIALAGLLKARGWSVDVLSRGYRREGDGVERVEVDAVDAALRFGDEPVLIQQRTGVPVWVGKERFASGRAAEITSDAAARKRVHLLDDGFQHRGLARAMDVVLVTEEDLADALLPAGNRREGLRALKRADVVVLREEERERVEAKVRAGMRADAHVWSVQRELQLSDASGVSNVGARYIAFCAIARPEGFWTMLAQAGCDVAERVAFDDHHRYDAADLDRLMKIAGERRAAGFITTEKDAVKLTPEMMERLRQVGPVCVAKLSARFVDEAAVVRELEARIG